MMNTEELYRIFIRHPVISIDSRDVQAGSIFFALKGKHFDGNRFAAEAIHKGAAFAIVDKTEVVKDSRYILVEDVLYTLQELAAFHRNHLRAPVIAITGTNGKTTTRELIKSVLSKKYRVCATIGNFNNHIGLPVTLLNSSHTCDVLIVEMGANHAGEIEMLCSIARPTHGMITNIGKAHMEGFGSLKQIIKSKTELYTALRTSGGTIFYRLDNDILNNELMSGDKTFSYGVSEDADIRCRNPVADPFLKFIWENKTGKRLVKTQLYGKYNFENIMAAIAVGTYFDVKEVQIAEAIESYMPANMRSQIIRAENNLIVMDAYNANPTSMTLAIAEFLNLSGRRKILILGDMFELGDKSEGEHKKIVRFIQDNKSSFEKIILVGRYFFNISDDPDTLSFRDTATLLLYLKKNVLKGFTILIKGSRMMKLERVLPLL